MLTPEEREYLTLIGYTLLDGITNLGAFTLTYGMFLGLFSIAVTQFSTNHPKSRPNKIIFALSVVSFILTTTYGTSIVTNVSITLREGLFITPGDALELSRLNNINGSLFRYDLIDNWLPRIMQLVADIIVVWRAWVLCFERRWLMILPCALLLGTFAATFAFFGLTSTRDAFDAFKVDTNHISVALYASSSALSLLTNAISTSIIGYTLWCTRKFWTQTVGRRSGWSRAQSTLLMIIESGAVYAVLQLVNTVIFGIPYYLDTPWQYFGQVVLGAFITLSAMYSTIVFLLVNNALSITNAQSLFWVDASSTRGGAEAIAGVVLSKAVHNNGSGEEPTAPIRISNGSPA